jgi:hypothetical protein
VICIIVAAVYLHFASRASSTVGFYIAATVVVVGVIILAVHSMRSSCPAASVGFFLATHG